MIALIPARGGSKGLPGKNIMKLNGVPLIGHTIIQAQKSNFISDVYVSTDCENIKRVAEEYGAKVPFLRPSELASDSSLAVDTYNHFIDYYEGFSGVKLGEIMILLPTSPLRNFNHINEAIELFFDKSADSVISFTKEHHPISWHKIIDKNLKIINFPTKLKNRQEENVTYYPNGSIFIFKTNLLKTNTYYTDNSYGYIMERRFSVDIDSIEDFEYAEFLISRYGI